MYVKENDIEIRQGIIEVLESKGYSLSYTDPRNRSEIISGTLPIVVDEENKVYHMMGNITCAAAAASSRKLITVEEFYKAVGSIV